MDRTKMTLAQLRAEAKARGLKGFSALKKEALIALLNEETGMTTSENYVRDEQLKEMPVKEELTKKESAKEESAKEELVKEEIISKEMPSREMIRRRRFPRENSGRDQENTNRENLNRENLNRENSNRENSNRENLNRENQNRENQNQEKSSRENTQQENRIENSIQEDTLKDGTMRAEGILEIVQDQGYGFIRSANYETGNNDVYVAQSQIRKFNLKTGDILKGITRYNSPNDKFAALIYIEAVNGYKPYEAQKRKNFEDLTPIFPQERIRLEIPGGPVSMRMLDLISPIGKGQRGMIVSQPKTGKTTLLKQIASSIIASEPNMKVIVLLIDERPEEVTDIRESIEGKNAEVIYSTFDETPEHHKRVSEMVLERAKRLVEHKEDVVILLDSITRLARAYNLTVTPSGRTLSGGLDPAALHPPKKFFGAARNVREGGSLTILATALVDTGSKMDDVVFEEFKGTGNMEVMLDRKLSEKRLFPAINIQKSSTRRDDLLLSKEEQDILFAMHRNMSGIRAEENMENILRMFRHTKNNKEFMENMRKSLNHLK